MFVNRKEKKIMSIEHIVNAWRNEEYRDRLSTEERALLPESPIGEIDLSESELQDVAGGSDTAFACGVTIAVTATLCPSMLNGGTCSVGTAACC
jgi:mersacidin/lichenicidin family type 2 lantibiotic